MLSTLENPVRILPVTMAALLGFISIFLLFTLKSLSRSIRRFEEAIKHIAAGDLDLPTASLAAGDFATLGNSLDTLRCQLKDDRERRDRFIMGVSHDLKTPLAVIQGYLDAIDDGLVAQAENPEKKMADYMAVMRTQAGILGTRIARLVDLAKTTTDVWLASLEASDFKIFFEETLHGISDYCATRGFTVETRVSLQSPCVLVFDHDMTRRILENLIDNALAYGDPLTSILVSATRTGEAGPIKVRVENGGAGIAPEHIKRVFEPFFRVDRSRNTGGFGLGLASVKSIVEIHGWSIDLESEPGIRTTFIITIPYDGSIRERQFSPVSHA
jgi:signal transduction histidine kinase